MAGRRLEDAKEGLKSCSLVGSNHRPQDNSIFYETYALPTELSELLFHLVLSKYIIRYTEGHNVILSY